MVQVKFDETKKEHFVGLKQLQIRNHTKTITLKLLKTSKQGNYTIR